MGFRSSLNNFSPKKGRCIFIATITVAVRCNSKWQTVSFKEGVLHCRNEHSRVFHLQPEHYEEKLGDLIKETAEDALENGWFREFDKRVDQSRTYIEQVEYLYCPSCQKLENDSVNQDPS